jgi:hypothetical protein
LRSSNQIETQTDAVADQQQEYEIQSLTLDFGDDLQSNASFRIVRLESKTLPVNEARVYVDNPDIFVPPNVRALTQVSTHRNSQGMGNRLEQNS